jgi:putative oxidoreductase
MKKPDPALLNDIGLLMMRILFGGLMAFGHGLPKLQGYANMSGGFPDPLGIGTVNSLNGAIFSELVCGLLILIGLGTRVAAIPAAFAMFIAAFVVHAQGPFFLPGDGAKEPAFLYLAGYLILMVTGSGKFSVDALISRARAGKSEAAAA